MPEKVLGGRFGLVTGGAGPLGRVLAASLAARGATVLALDHPQATELEGNAAAPSNVTLVACDLTVTDDLERLVEYLDGRDQALDFVINNAAFTGGANLGGYAVPFEDQTDAAFDAALALNLAVPFRLTRRLLPWMRRSSRCSIVNISSIYGLVGPDLRLYQGTTMGNPAGYAASKGGLVQLTRYLATVLAPGIRVNCVAPGGIAREQDPGFVGAYEARTPLGRMAREEDIIGAVCWLVSDDASYVTGQTIAVDGGWTAW